MFEAHENNEQGGTRLCNVISLMIPAYRYDIGCAWTQEIPLPAIEEFTCRLLIAMGELAPSELQGYFDINAREIEVLIDTLTKNKLVKYNDQNNLVPSTILLDRTKGNPDSTPSLTKYETKNESVVFEALTVTVMPSKNLQKGRYGLPEIPIPAENHSPAPSRVAEAFGRQFRAFLDYSNKPEFEKRKTRLYKVESCGTGRFVQIPIDIDIWVKPSQDGQVEVVKAIQEGDGSTRHRPLSMEIQAKLSDYLNDLGKRMPVQGMSLERYCRVFDDPVLERYVDDRGLDLGPWLIDHANRKTGFGSTETRAIVGPVYAKNNQKTLEQALKTVAEQWKPNDIHRAFWLASNVPLWGANTGLRDFGFKLSKLLTENGEDRGSVTAIMGLDDFKDCQRLKSLYHTRIANGIVYRGSDLASRVEILLIPGQLAVVQYHVQPDSSSAVTVPVGYITHDLNRLERVEAYLDDQVRHRGKATLAWSDGAADADELLGSCKTLYATANRKPTLSLAKTPGVSEGEGESTPPPA